MRNTNSMKNERPRYMNRINDRGNLRSRKECEKILIGFLIQSQGNLESINKKWKLLRKECSETKKELLEILKWQNQKFNERFGKESLENLPEHRSNRQNYRKYIFFKDKRCHSQRLNLTTGNSRKREQWKGRRKLFKEIWLKMLIKCWTVWMKKDHTFDVLHIFNDIKGKKFLNPREKKGKTYKGLRTTATPDFSSVTLDTMG